MDLLNSIMSNGWSVFILMIVCLVLLVVAVKKLFGAVSIIPRSVCVCFSIIFIYIICIIFSDKIGEEFNALVLAMPFGEIISAGKIVDFAMLYQQSRDGFGGFFGQMVQIFYLAVIVIFVQSIVHKSDKKDKDTSFMKEFVMWFCKECIVLAIAIVANMIIGKTFSVLTEHMGWIGKIIGSAPMLVFVAMFILLLVLAVIKVVKAIILLTVPVFGLLLSFFSDNQLGKSVISAFVATGIMIALIGILGELKLDIYGRISSSLQASGGILIVALMILVLLAIWFAVYRLWKLTDK